jgi:hypothetical protein
MMMMIIIISAVLFITTTTNSNGLYMDGFVVAATSARTTIVSSSLKSGSSVDLHLPNHFDTIQMDATHSRRRRSRRRKRTWRTLSRSWLTKRAFSSTATAATRTTSTTRATYTAAMATFRDHPPEVLTTVHTNGLYDPPVVHTTNQQKTSSLLLLWGRMKTHPSTKTTTSGTQKKSSTTQSTNSTGRNRKYNDDNNNKNLTSKKIINVINRSNDKTKTKTITSRKIHPALLFLEPPIQHEISQQQPQRQNHNSVTNTIPRIPTRVGMLAQAFSTVLTTTKSDEWEEDDYDPDNTQTTTTKTMMIDMDQLLIACHQFEQAMMDVEQKLSARDLRNNIAKVESLYHNIPKISTTTTNNNNKLSLSEKNYHNMEAILRYEKEQNVHQYEETNNNNDPTQQHSTSSSSSPKLIALNEQSCAMGLLWIRRSLQFQYHLFHSLLQDIDATTATMAAYEQTLQPYHSWALQKIYNMAVKSATPSNQIWLARLGGYEQQSDDHHSHSMDNTAVTTTTTKSSSSSTPIYTKNDAEQATRQDLQLLLQIWGPLIQEWERIYTKLNLEDQRRV